MTLTPRNYQIPAIEAMAKTDLGILVAAAGSGKTVMIALSIKMREVMEARPLKCLWLAGTKELLEQGREACSNAGILGEVTFRCWQGMAEIPKDIDLLFCDECHGCGAPNYKALLRTTLTKSDSGEWVRNCITWACTAAPFREDDQDLTPILGPVAYTVPREAIKEAGGVLSGIYTVREFYTKEGYERSQKVIASKVRKWMNDEQVSRVVWQAVLSECITKCEERNVFIAKVCAEFSGQSILCLCDTVLQCQSVADKVQGAVAFHSKMGAKKRRDSLQDFKDGIIPILVCTSIAEQGLDVPIASVLIQSRARKARGGIEQMSGRVLRPYKSQSCGLIVDIKDVSHKMTEIQHYQRVRLYKKWGYKNDQ